MVTRKVYSIVYVVIGVALVLSVPSFIGANLSANDLKGFDDSILFEIDWPGEDLGFPGVSSDTLLLTTANNEKYKCLVPEFRDKGKSPSEGYTGPNPYELLKPVFSDYNSCSYRLESYWTYELCHGKHIRQYHEEREGKKVLVQEYFLGKWDEEEASNLEKILAKEEEEPKLRSDTHLKKIYGLKRRYVQVNMTGGTLCDLNQQPRRTKVIYVCYPHGKQEIYSLKETSTCEYEVIVLSQVLCFHPKYKPQESSEYVVSCHSMENTPKMPKSLVDMDEENFRLRHQKMIFDTGRPVRRRPSTPDAQQSSSYTRAVLVESDGEHRVRIEIHHVDAHDKQPSPVADETPALTDTTPVANFLSGKSCLHGGTGWWKYKFCHGKSVDQYHTEKDLRRTVINLGKFIKANHLEWLEQNPHKRPKPPGIRKSISHFYSEGSICDKTGRPRQTEVKLKCLEQVSSSSAVALYLLEPRPCEYILGVESHLVCENVILADDDGLVMVRGNGEEHEDVTFLLDGSVLAGDDDEEDAIDESPITNGDE